MRQTRVAPLAWGQNLAAWLIATALCLFLAKWDRPWTLRLTSGRAVMCLLILVLFTTFWFPGLESVHRWLVFGAVRVHAGELVMPVLLIALASVREEHMSSAWVLGSLASVLLVFQPDAAQATAFTVPAAFLLMTRGRARTPSGWIGSIALFGLVAAAWTRRDPLGSVSHVEGIVGLAADLGLACGIAAVTSLALLPIPFLAFYLRWRGRRNGEAALALAIYFTLSLVVCLTGKFPVPLMGYGISPFVGYYLAIAWLVVQYKLSKLSGCGPSHGLP